MNPDSVVGPFEFKTRMNLIELLGRKARNVVQLLEGIREVPESSIYYHTHRFLQQHHYLSPEPPNDFAFWIMNALGLDELGEALASVDTVTFRSTEELRERFIQILKRYVGEEDTRITNCQPGEEFHFMSCRTFILPTAHKAHDRAEFVEILEKVTIDTLYFHIFEARLRLERGDNDFSNWFEGLGERKLARELSRLDPYTITMEGLRRKIIDLAKRHGDT